MSDEFFSELEKATGIANCDRCNEDVSIDEMKVVHFYDADDDEYFDLVMCSKCRSMITEE